MSILGSGCCAVSRDSICVTALPSSVRKGCAFPEPTLHKLSPRLSLGEEKSRMLSVRQSLTAQKGAEPHLISTQLLAIAFEVALHLADAVAAKLLAHSRSQHQRHHRFANHARRWNCRNVGPLKRR
jgi:hypothetical protein